MLEDDDIGRHLFVLANSVTGPEASARAGTVDCGPSKATLDLSSSKRSHGLFGSLMRGKSRDAIAKGVHMALPIVHGGGVITPRVSVGIRSFSRTFALTRFTPSDRVLFQANFVSLVKAKPERQRWLELKLPRKKGTSDDLTRTNFLLLSQSSLSP